MLLSAALCSTQPCSPFACPKSCVQLEACPLLLTFGRCEQELSDVLWVSLKLVAGFDVASSHLRSAIDSHRR